MFCTLVYIVSYILFSESSNDSEEKFDFTFYFNDLLKKKTCVDVVFKLKTKDGEVELFAHQLVLAMRSAYFADMFYGNEKEQKNKIIRLETTNPKAVEDVIR